MNLSSRSETDPILVNFRELFEHPSNWVLYTNALKPGHFSSWFLIIYLFILCHCCKKCERKKSPDDKFLCALLLFSFALNTVVTGRDVCRILVHSLYKAIKK